MKTRKPNPPLRSIQEELRACRNAWARYRRESKWNGQLAWCIHHLEHIEPLNKSPFKRISVIRFLKPESERAARLRSFRPVKSHVRIKTDVRIKKIAAILKQTWSRSKTSDTYKLALDAAMRELNRLPLGRIHDEQYPDNAWGRGRVMTTDKW